GVGGGRPAPAAGGVPRLAADDRPAPRVAPDGGRWADGRRPVGAGPNRAGRRGRPGGGARGSPEGARAAAGAVPGAGDAPFPQRPGVRGDREVDRTGERVSARARRPRRREAAGRARALVEKTTWPCMNGWNRSRIWSSP